MSTQPLPATAAPAATVFLQKIDDYKQFVKLRLTLLVVFSAGIGYLVAARGHVDFATFALLILGGFLITASANGINQILEKDTDLLMERTQNRPVATGRISLVEAICTTLAMGMAGVAIIALRMNMLSAELGLLSLVLYGFVYTPLKRYSSISVFVGALPGALPVLIGYAAFSGHLNFEAGMLFFTQFIWQFPHFWAIAWVLHDDYTRGGFRMLPTAEPGRATAFQVLLYAAFLIPIGLVPYFFGLNSLPAGLAISAAGGFFTYKALKLFQVQDRKTALGVMFGSFIYLPFVQLAYLADVLIRQ